MPEYAGILCGSLSDCSGQGVEGRGTAYLLLKGRLAGMWKSVYIIISIT